MMMEMVSDYDGTRVRISGINGDNVEVNALFRTQEEARDYLKDFLDKQYYLA